MKQENMILFQILSQTLRKEFKGMLAGIIVIVLSLLLLACGQSEPYKFGFIGGLSGRISDLGGPARNGMLLAVEEVNQQGGINGRLIETVVKDDKQDVSVAKQAVSDLLSQNVDVIMGPVTSSIAVAVREQATEAKTLMFGITTTSNDLSGHDDYYIRILSPTKNTTKAFAKYLFNRGLKDYAIIYDATNENYSLSWIRDFDRHFQSFGGKHLRTLHFNSGDHAKLIELADQVVSYAPELVVFVANASDAAMLAKLVKQRTPYIQIATSEWSGTERLIELGGKHIEGAVVPQYYDRYSQEEDYQAFRQRFLERFDHEPGFPGLFAYNATKIVIEALQTNPDASALKQQILNMKTFKAIQYEVNFDQYGDVSSVNHITIVKNGQYRAQATPQ